MEDSRPRSSKARAWKWRALAIGAGAILLVLFAWSRMSSSSGWELNGLTVVKSQRSEEKVGATWIVETFLVKEDLATAYHLMKRNLVPSVFPKYEYVPGSYADIYGGPSGRSGYSLLCADSYRPPEIPNWKCPPGSTIVVKRTVQLPLWTKIKLFLHL